MGLFNTGYKAVDEERKRQENKRSLFRFFIVGDGAEADIRFLTDKPITFSEHSVKSVRNGKDVYDNVICTGEEKPCTLCANGERPSFKGAYLIWDNREYETKDANGKKKKVKGSLKLYVAGTKILSQIQRLYSKYGLLDKEYTIVRLGEGTNTTYTFERGDDLAPLSKKEIEDMLPDNLRKLYDGTQDSLLDIIQKVLEADLPTNSGVSDSNNGEDEVDYDNQTVSIDDEEEDEPKKPTLPKHPSSAKGILRKRHS